MWTVRRSTKARSQVSRLEQGPHRPYVQVRVRRASLVRRKAMRPPASDGDLSRFSNLRPEPDSNLPHTPDLSNIQAAESSIVAAIRSLPPKGVGRCHDFSSTTA